MKDIKDIKVNELTEKEADDLIGRTEDAINIGLCLEDEDLIVLLDAFKTCLHLQEKVKNNDLTILKLKKLLGMVKSSEKKSTLTDVSNDVANSTDNKDLPSDKQEPNADKDSDKKQNKKKKRNQNKTDFPQKKPNVVHHKHKKLAKGQQCPECLNGRLYKYLPSQFTRITGHSPFTATIHVSERFKCNNCGSYITAELPEEVRDEGEPGQKYAHSARSLMSLFKFFAGYPFYRQASLQKILGVSITASTQFDQVELVANDANPVYEYLAKEEAPQAPKFKIDDTRHKVIELKETEKKRRNSSKTQKRTGIYCSGLIAKTKDNHKIVLFKTNIGHAGEFIDEVLSLRDTGLPPPQVMSDALSSNKPTVTEVEWLKCNVHGRRQFYDIASSFKSEALYILDEYEIIFKNEDETKTNHMDDAERLKYHKNHSLPVMERIFSWCKSKLESGEAEENGGLGKACRYMLNHEKELIKFCYVEGAAIDNNEMEAMLKIVILGRKNYSFFKTAAGAAVANVMISIIATAHQASINIFDYLTDIQRYRDHVKANPAMWVPWKYEETIKLLTPTQIQIIRELP